ncbi:MAG: 6-carboxytetrahydropterin synthase QueD [Myxococcales bacterium]|nr:6-carboxytetrahydropterin synthase QueD [Myxococcales bacterium]
MARALLEKDFRLESAHSLPRVPASHKCARIHGHSFRITIRVEGDIDEATGWVVDYGDLAAAWQPLHEVLDHRYLNEVPGLENPTSENLARWILEHYRVPTDRARLVSVTVHETCQSRCTVLAES